MSPRDWSVLEEQRGLAGPEIDSLVARAQSGDRSALELVVRHCWDLVEKVAAGFFYPGADHEDIVQWGMIGLLGAVRTYRPQPGPGRSFEGFAGMVVRRWIITGLKYHQREKFGALNSAVGLSELREGEFTVEERTAGGLQPDEILEQRDQVRRLLRTLNGLSPLERHAIDARLHGVSYRELKAEHGYSHKQVDNAIQRAARKFREAA